MSKTCHFQKEFTRHQLFLSLTGFHDPKWVKLLKIIFAAIGESFTEEFMVVD